MKKRIVTLAVVLACVLAGSQLTGCSRLRAAARPAGSASDVTVTAVIKASPLGLEKEIHVGDTVRVKDSGSTIGKVASVTTSPTLDSVGTADGRLVAAVVPNEEDIWLTVAGSAVPGDDGYRFSGERVWVNQDVKMITPFAFFTGTVTDIKETSK